MDISVQSAAGDRCGFFVCSFWFFLFVSLLESLAACPLVGRTLMRSINRRSTFQQMTVTGGIYRVYGIDVTSRSQGVG